MIPTVDDRISSLQRTLQDIVLPALSPEQGLAIEQTQLVIGHLAVLREQFDLAHSFERRECRELEELAAALVAEADGGALTMAAATRLREVLAAKTGEDAQELRDRIVALSLGIEDLVTSSGADGGASFAAVSRELILESNESSSLRGRSFFRAMGFERGDVALPAIRELLGS